MTKAEMLALVNVLATADGGCGPCVESLMVECFKRLPDLPWAEAWSQWAKTEDATDYYWAEDLHVMLNEAKGKAAW